MKFYRIYYHVINLILILVIFYGNFVIRKYISFNCYRFIIPQNKCVSGKLLKLLKIESLENRLQIDIVQ